MDVLRKAAAVSTTLIALMFLAPLAASAAPTTWQFFGCSGTAETPPGFTATHANSAGAAFALTDGTAVFTVLIFEDLTAGKESGAPGHDVTGNATTTCMVVNPFTGHVLRFSGFFTPR